MPFFLWHCQHFSDSCSMLGEAVFCALLFAKSQNIHPTAGLRLFLKIKRFQARVFFMCYRTFPVGIAVKSAPPPWGATNAA